MMPLQHRDQRIQVLVTPQEKERIETVAKSRGLSSSAYVRRLILEDLKRERSAKKT